jgi:hypothetical protein
VTGVPWRRLGPRTVAVLVAAAGCGGGAPDVPGAPDADDVAVDADPRCPRTLRPADRPRKVVVSLPFGTPRTLYKVLDLDPAGGLTDPGVGFELGRSSLGEIAFTPDGAVGLVAQDDGSLGVFRFDDAGDPVVVHAAYTAGFYAARVIVDPDGTVAYVLDTQWREHGGGIYRVGIGCDGALADLGLWTAAKLPGGLQLAGERALVAAADVLGSPAGHDAHLLDWTADPPARLGGVDAFGDDDAIVGGTAVTADGRHFLIGDTSAFATAPNRIAVVAVDGDTLTAAQVIAPVEDPIALVASPHGDVVLAVSGYGDAIFVLEETGGAVPFAAPRPLSYLGARPQLPSAAVAITRGALAGLALVAELQGVRRVRMTGGGTVTDLGLTQLGDGAAAITGALGVQP